MLIKRLALLVISLALGYATNYIVVIFVLGTTIAEYMWGPEFIPLPYWHLSGLTLAIFWALILDKFMGTDMLPG